MLRVTVDLTGLDEPGVYDVRGPSASVLARVSTGSWSARTTGRASERW